MNRLPVRVARNPSFGRMQKVRSTARVKHYHLQGPSAPIQCVAPNGMPSAKNARVSGECVPLWELDFDKSG